MYMALRSFQPVLDANCLKITLEVSDVSGILWSVVRNVFSASGSRTFKGLRRASLANRRFFYAHFGPLRIRSTVESRPGREGVSATYAVMNLALLALVVTITTT